MRESNRENLKTDLAVVPRSCLSSGEQFDRASATAFGVKHKMKDNTYQPYQPKTGEKCHCKRGIERDNCPVCEGTGWKIDFRAIRERVAIRNTNSKEAR